MTRTPPDRARRMDEARRSLKAAMIDYLRPTENIAGVSV